MSADEDGRSVEESVAAAKEKALAGDTASREMLTLLAASGRPDLRAWLVANSMISTEYAAALGGRPLNDADLTRMLDEGEITMVEYVELSKEKEQALNRRGPLPKRFEVHTPNEKRI